MELALQCIADTVQNLPGKRSSYREIVNQNEHPINELCPATQAESKDINLEQPKRSSPSHELHNKSDLGTDSSQQWWHCNVSKPPKDSP